MTKVFILTEKEDSDKTKLEWLKDELVKRDIETSYPDFDSFDEYFRSIKDNITPDTILIAKGKVVNNMLNELEVRQLGLKGLFLVTDNTNIHKIIFKHDFETIKKRAVHFFIYAFQNSETFSVSESNEIANKLEAELSILEGADDNSDYEEILIDILSLENQ